VLDGHSRTEGKQNPELQEADAHSSSCEQDAYSGLPENTVDVIGDVTRASTDRPIHRDYWLDTGHLAW
jgi:hypothetical protein